MRNLVSDVEGVQNASGLAVKEWIAWRLNQAGFRDPRRFGIGLLRHEDGYRQTISTVTSASVQPVIDSSKIRASLVYPLPGGGGEGR
jgi:hypothetical protein